MKRYEFDMENGNMKGHWVGIFEKTPVGTVIDFTEDVEVKNPVLKLLASIYLSKQQQQYIADLRKVLGE